MSNGALDPVDAPPYVVLYTGAHLERVNAGVADLCALLTPEWRTACEAVEGGLTGFATDTGRAWRAARRENERLIAAGQPPHEIGAEALCFLVRTRIRALAQSIPAPIAGRLVQEGIWQPQQGIAYARNMDPSLAKVQMLAEMSRHGDAKTGGELLDEARLLIDGWSDAEERGEAFNALIAAGGSDELLTDLLKLPLAQYDGIWTDAAKALIASGRAADVSRVSAAGKYIKAQDALHSMIELGQFDEAATVWPLLVHMLDFFSAPTLSFRLALHGHFVPDHRGVDPDPRISRIAERIRNGLPLDLDRNDLPWLVELFTVWDLTPDLAEIACAAAAAMDDGLRTVLLRDVPPRLYVDDRVLRRVALLQPPEEARKQLRELLRTGSSYEARHWIMETAPLMHGDLIAESLKRMLQDSSDVLDLGMSGVLELFLRHAPAAVQDALGKLNPGRAALKVLSVAARLDTEHRQELVRRLFEIYRESEPWERRGADLAALVPFLDRSMTLAAVDVFTRFNDRTWSDTAMFVFDASAPPPAPLIEAWRSSAEQVEAVVAAAVVPQHAEAALRTLLTATNLSDPTFILNASWAAELLLPAAEARAFHKDVWTRVGANPVAYVESFADVSKLPDPEWTAGWVERIPRPAERGEALKAEIGRALLLPSSARREAVRAIEADYSIEQLIDQDLEHIAGDLSGELVSALLARALSDDGDVNRRLIAAIAPRLSQDEIHRVIEHVASLSVSVRAPTMTALLPVLEDARRKEAIRWLLSPEVIAESEILELAGRPLSADLRAEIIKAVQALDPVQTARALAGEPDDLVVGVIIASRILSLQPAVARKLATIVFDVSWQASSPNEAWRGLYSLRPLLLQSGDAHLFPDILQAIRRATAIFP